MADTGDESDVSDEEEHSEDEEHEHSQGDQKVCCFSPLPLQF